MYTTQYPQAKLRQSSTINSETAEAAIDGVALQSHSGRRADAEPAHATRLETPNPARLPIGGRIALSLDYMKVHLNEPIRISTLCAITGYSQSRFFDVFKSATGDTPLNWFIRARMRWGR